MKKIFTLWLPVLVWMGIIFFFSSNSDPYRLLPVSLRQFASSPVLEGATLSDFLNPLMHFFPFGILAFLISRALFHQIIKSKNVIMLSIVITMAYALSDEVHQLFVPGRTFQWGDLLVDLIGAFVGILIYMKCRK